jgi:hypothetical protein
MEVKKYRGGGMSSDPRASKLAKMMQAYRNGGYVYAQNGGQVPNPWKNPNREQAGFVYDIAGSMMRDQPWYQTPLAWEDEQIEQKGGLELSSELAFKAFQDSAIQEALSLQKINPKSEKGKLIAESVANELERDFIKQFQKVAPEEARKGFGRMAPAEFYENLFSERMGYNVEDPGQSLLMTPDMEQKFFLGKPDEDAGPGGWKQKVDPKTGKLMYRMRSGEDPFEAAFGYSQRGFTYMPESERTRPEFEPIEKIQQRGPSRIPGGINQPGGMLEAALRNRGLMR